MTLTRDFLDVVTRNSHIDGYGVNILSVECRACGAVAHVCCTSRFGAYTKPHSIRYGIARKAAGVVTPHCFRNSRSQCWPHNV